MEPDVENADTSIFFKPFNLIENQEIMEEIVRQLIDTEIQTGRDFEKFLVSMRRQYKIPVGNVQLLYTYRILLQERKIMKNKTCESFLKAKSCRSNSGVMVVTVVTSPYPKSGEKITKFSCPYNCHYCPAEPDQPRSYLLKEPAVHRANRNKFDAVDQFRDRGSCYIVNGHPFDKVELIVLGGTWSSYPEDYKEEFVRDLYYAGNTFFDKNFMITPRERKSLDEEIKLNETALCRIIGLTIETRPDQIHKKELMTLRRYGVTRIQLGIQHTDDEILRGVNRQCTTKKAIHAIKMLKDTCFKVDIHLMPDLPGSSPEKDEAMFRYILESPDLQVDQWKIYPCEVVPWTEIKKWYDEGSYKPYADCKYEMGINSRKIQTNPLFELLIRVKHQVHPWIRINRIIRDIPSEYISAGNDAEDLRQHLQKEMRLRNLACKCIRCREVKDKKTNIEEAQLVVRTYDASGGKEFFMSYESPDQKILYGFLRLRLSNHTGANIFPELEKTALIRELHVYGKVIPVYSKDMKDKKSVQHGGFGTKLLLEAQKIAKENGFMRIAVISGVGVRNYYRKLGFVDEEYFLIKNLDS
jgi:ELP3 family radical SAM enzyme/protein acetyltransferase